MNKDLFLFTSRVRQFIRDFFSQKGFLEVDTPLLSPNLIPESCLEVFSTKYECGDHRDKELYLIPSPEVWMKRILARDPGNIFQICKSFRNGEQAGSFHNPEFTMLEWYELNADYKVSLDRTKELLLWLAEKLSGYVQITMKQPVCLTVEQAFEKYAQVQLAPCCVPGTSGLSAMRCTAESKGLQIPESYSWAEIFDRLLIEFVEPALPKDSPVFLIDYPSRIKTLSKDKYDSVWSQRWELYLAGVELANCFTEEDDPLKVKEFFEYEINAQKVHHAVDREYYRIFEKTFPECSGVAMGVDRLCMILLGKKSIADVIFWHAR